MTKTIILSNGVAKQMTFEEVLKQFTPMINKAANIFLNKFSNVDREEIMQDLEIAAWEAYESYNGKFAFSTHLTYQLKSVTGNHAQKITAQKRTSLGVLSMNSTIGDTEDLTLEDMFAEEDYTAESMIAGEMMELILKNLDEREKEELRCLMYPKEFGVTKLAELRGITRQATNQRVNKTKAKIQQLLIANQFVTA